MTGTGTRTGQDGAPRPRIDCRQCINFYITWEKKVPYGCRGHGFKSAMMPSIVVFNSSGSPCLMFYRKPQRP